MSNGGGGGSGEFIFVTMTSGGAGGAGGSCSPGGGGHSVPAYGATCHYTTPRIAHPRCAYCGLRTMAADRNCQGCGAPC